MGSTREPLTFHSVVLSSAARKVLSQIGPYFDDADQERPPVMIWSLDWKTVKKTIKAWVCEWYEKSRKTGHG